MKQYVQTSGKTVGLWLLIAMLAACGEEQGTAPDAPSPSGQIRVYTAIRDGGAAEQSANGPEQACLIFWREESYREILAGNWPQREPYVVARPEEPIDYYRVANGIPYNTERSYPPGGKHVHVAGFAPAGLRTSDYYETLTIPVEMRNGKIDFLSGDGSSRRVGTVEKPFEKGSETEKEAKQLEFCHLTAKIRFEAKRAESMANRIGVRNIRIRLKGQRVPAELRWQRIPDAGGATERGGYFPTASVVVDPILLEAHRNEVITWEGSQSVDSCFVYASGNHYHADAGGNAPTESGTIRLNMDIEAELLPYDEETGEWDTGQAKQRIWENQTVEIHSKTGSEWRMGYSYTVTITFDVNDLRLQGMEMPWEHGGNYYIPITPVDKETGKTTDKQEGGEQ